MDACHWVKDRDVPGGRFLVPGCLNRAIYGDLAECHCQNKPTIADSMDAIIKRLDRLEKRLALPDPDRTDMQEGKR
jgi:hypothetical protein